MLNIKFHSEEQCIGPCPLHKSSDHHMRDWPLVYRYEKGIFERTCSHGVGHPDPDLIKRAIEYDENTYVSIHGCDGCCIKGDNN